MKSKLRRMTAAAFALGLVSGWAGLRWFDTQARAGTGLLSARSERARLDADDKARFSVLKADLRTAIGARRRAGTLLDASVSFRELRGGASFHIGQHIQYAPASLLKLPFAFVVLVMEEDEPGFLQQELRYARQELVGYDVPEAREVAPTGLVHGRNYPVSDLLEHVIAESDNLAYYLLLQHVLATPSGRRCFERTFRELGVRDPVTLSEQAASTREYSALLARLYDASYLSVEASELLLGWLSGSAFDAGIAAGVGRDALVANKFGERYAEDGSAQLHDCGIVYHDRRPYALCVMTRGQGAEGLKAAITDISQRVYAAVADSAR